MVLEIWEKKSTIVELKLHKLLQMQYSDTGKIACINFFRALCFARFGS